MAVTERMERGIMSVDSGRPLKIATSDGLESQEQ